MATVLLRCYWKQRERKAREAIVPAEPCPSLPSLKSCVAAVWDLDTANTSIRMRAQAGDGRPCVLNSDESVSRIWTVARALGTMRVQIHVMQSLSAKPVVPSTPKVSTPLRRVKNVQNLRAVFGQVSFRYQVGQTLGNSRHAVMKLCLNTSTGGFVVMQALPSSMRAAVEKEAAVLMSAPHKHLVKVVGVDAHVEGEVRLFTEYVPGGTVASFLRRFGTLEEVVIQQYVRQCVLALAHLHAKGLAHRDLTVDNIMVASDGTIKLGGVGAGSLADRAADTHGDGTPNSSQGRPKLEADIWDLGMAVLDMSLGIDAGRTESLTCPDDGDAHATASGEEPPVPEALSAAGQTFVRRCLARDRSQRPSATDLLAMPFLEGINTAGPGLQRKAAMGPRSLLRYRPASADADADADDTQDAAVVAEFWSALGREPPSSSDMSQTMPVDHMLRGMEVQEVNEVDDGSPSPERGAHARPGGGVAVSKSAGAVVSGAGAGAGAAAGHRWSSGSYTSVGGDGKSVATSDDAGWSPSRDPSGSHNESRHSESSMGGSARSTGTASDAPASARVLASLPSRLNTMGFTLQPSVGGSARLDTITSVGSFADDSADFESLIAGNVPTMKQPAMSPEKPKRDSKAVLASLPSRLSDSRHLSQSSSSLHNTGPLNSTASSLHSRTSGTSAGTSAGNAATHDGAAGAGGGARKKKSAVSFAVPDGGHGKDGDSRRRYIAQQSSVAYDNDQMLLTDAWDMVDPEAEAAAKRKQQREARSAQHKTGAQPKKRTGAQLQFIKQFKTATEESERDLMAAMRAAEGGAGRGSGSDDGDEDGSGGGADGDPTATLDDKMVLTDAWDMVDPDEAAERQRRERRLSGVDDKDAPKQRTKAQLQFIKRFKTHNDDSSRDLVAAARAELARGDSGHAQVEASGEGASSARAGPPVRALPASPGSGGVSGSIDDDAFVLTDAWDMVDPDAVAAERRRSQRLTGEKPTAKCRTGAQLRFISQFKTQNEASDRDLLRGRGGDTDAGASAAPTPGTAVASGAVGDAPLTARAPASPSARPPPQRASSPPLSPPSRAQRSADAHAASAEDPMVLTDAWDLVDPEAEDAKRRRRSSRETTSPGGTKARTGAQLTFLNRFRTRHEDSARDLQAAADGQGTTSPSPDAGTDGAGTDSHNSLARHQVASASSRSLAGSVLQSSHVLLGGSHHLDSSHMLLGEHDEDVVGVAATSSAPPTLTHRAASAAADGNDGRRSPASSGSSESDPLVLTDAWDAVNPHAQEDARITKSRDKAAKRGSRELTGAQRAFLETHSGSDLRLDSGGGDGDAGRARDAAVPSIEDNDVDQPSPAGGGAGTPALRSSDSSVTTLSLPTRKLATSVFSDDDDATASVSPGGAGSSEGAASDRVRTPRGNGKRKKLRRHSSSGVARRLTSMLNPAKWWRHKKRQDDNMPVLRPRVAVSDRGEEPRTAGARRAVKSDGSHASAVRDTPIYSPVTPVDSDQDVAFQVVPAGSSRREAEQGRPSRGGGSALSPASGAGSGAGAGAGAMNTRSPPALVIDDEQDLLVAAAQARPKALRIDAGHPIVALSQASIGQPQPVTPSNLLGVPRNFMDSGVFNNSLPGAANPTPMARSGKRLQN